MLRFVHLTLLALALGSCGNTLVMMTNATNERLGLEVKLFDAEGQRREPDLSLCSVAVGDTVQRHFTVRQGERFQIEAYTGDFVKVKSWNSPLSTAGGKPFKFVVRESDLAKNTFYLQLGPR